ncbi:hypothetical protein F5B20DRAFT_58171 [Whalleya microplaca]|nr:hypothetical protein F5B20DRAFT_58171 [Whalleya microplaca]
MAESEASKPAREPRDDEPVVSPVSNSAASSHEQAQATTSDRAQRPVVDDNEVAPPLPTRPTPSPVAHSLHSQQKPHPQPYQQSYAPYPYPPQQYPYGQPVRALPPYSKSWTVSKLVLTILSLVFAVVIMALSCIFAGEGSDAEVTAYYALPISIIAILWNGAELITFCARARKDVKRGIHPGAHVGMHLCFWLACIFAILITIVVYLGILGRMEDCEEYQDSRYYSRYYGYCSSDYHYQLSGGMTDMYLPTLRAVIALWCLALIDHFVLFVMACIDTHKRNLMKPAGFVMPPCPPGMYYAPPPGATPYYPYPMPMPPPQARFAPQPNAESVASPPPQNPQAPQNYQSFAGFYAPPVPPQAAATASPSNEKVAPAPVAQAV